MFYKMWFGGDWICSIKCGLEEIGLFYKMWFGGDWMCSIKCGLEEIGCVL